MHPGFLSGSFPFSGVLKELRSDGILYLIVQSFVLLVIEYFHWRTLENILKFPSCYHWYFTKIFTNILMDWKKKKKKWGDGQPKYMHILYKINSIYVYLQIYPHCMHVIEKILYEVLLIWKMLHTVFFFIPQSPMWQ